MSESKWKRANSVISGIPRLKTNRSISSSAETISRSISPLKQVSGSKIPTSKNMCRAQSLPNIVKATSIQNDSLSLNKSCDPINEGIDKVSHKLTTFSEPDPPESYTDENNWLMTIENENHSCKELQEGALALPINDVDNKILDCSKF